MDLVLEVFDTFLLDKVYAKVLPRSLVSSGADLEGLGAAANASASAMVGWGSTWNLGTARFDRYGIEKTFIFEPSVDAYASLLGRGNLIRQALSLTVITTIFGWILYLGTAYLSYKFVYDHENFKHPKYLKNQIRMEITQAVGAIPFMTMLTVPWFLMEVQGFGKLYWDPKQYGMWYMVMQFPLFLLFTDCLIYMIHRGLHHPRVYKHLHKPHHKWIISTPFASHAFHPLDGYFQSLPYHIFPFVFPLHKVSYVMLFMIVNVWTVMIHDGEYLANDPVINGSACHTMHHIYFNYNYGQYTTLWDRIGRTYRQPDQELFNKSTKMAQSTWQKQSSQMEVIQKEVEGDDFRVYASNLDKAGAAKRG